MPRSRDLRQPTRREVVLSGGAVAGAALLAGCGGSAASGETAQFGDGDIGILNYFLGLEHEQVEMYAALISSGQFQGTELEMLRTFLGQEREHVSHLTRLLRRQGGGGEAQRRAGFQLSGQGPAALAQVREFEDLVANAYLGQLAHIEDRVVLAVAVAIQSVEGRHAAVLAIVTGNPISPDGAFAKPANAREVMRSVDSASGE